MRALSHDVGPVQLVIPFNKELSRMEMENGTVAMDIISIVPRKDAILQKDVFCTDIYG